MARIFNSSRVNASLNRSIFKAYDIRGKYPGEINERQVMLTAEGLVEKLRPKKVVIGCDARLSSPKLYGVLKKSLKASKASFIELGVTTSPAFYFAVNRSGADLGLMVTASHNPKEYNGLKVVREKAIPMSGTEAYGIIMHS